MAALVRNGRRSLSTLVHAKKMPPGGRTKILANMCMSGLLLYILWLADPWSLPFLALLSPVERKTRVEQPIKERQFSELKDVSVHRLRLAQASCLFSPGTSSRLLSSYSRTPSFTSSVTLRLVSRVSGQRVTLRHVSNRPPPNPCLHVSAHTALQTWSVVCLDRFSPRGSRHPPHGRGHLHSPAALPPVSGIAPSIRVL